MTILESEAQRNDVRTPASEPRLLVTRQDPGTRQYTSIGFLSYDGAVYRFDYLSAAVAQPGFQPLPGLSSIRHHESARLFPIFAERVMSARRPDREASLQALDLGLDAAPFEVLSRSGGRRVGDTIELIAAPSTDAHGRLSADFLLHGVRHVRAHAQHRISALRKGDELRLVPDLSNPVQPRALLVADEDETPLGWVPDPLLEVIERLQGETVRVVRANGPEVGFHLRLLVNVSGTWPFEEQPFSGQSWETI
jgi:hypothetical protein